MDNRENFTKETLKRIRSGEQTPATKRSRRLSRGILIADAIVVLLVLLFLFGREDDAPAYSSTVAFANKVSYRLSLNEGDGKAYIFSLSMESKDTVPRELTFPGEVGSLSLFFGDRAVITRSFGKEVKLLPLLPGEVRTFIVTLPREEISHSLAPVYSKPEPENLAEALMGVKGPPLNGVATIRGDATVALALNFTFEVQE